MTKQIESIESATVDPESLGSTPSMTADVAKRFGITEKLAEVRKASPTANVCMVRFVGGGSTPYRLTDVVHQVAKDRTPARPPADELVAPVTKAAHEHNVDVVKRRRSDFDAYVAKVATERNVTVTKASEELAGARDPEYTRLWKRASDALHSPLRAQQEASKAAYTSFDAERHAARAAAEMNRANAEAQTMARMTPSEAKLHKMAHDRSVNKKIGFGEAMTDLMERDSEAIKLYRKIAFEKHGR